MLLKSGYLYELLLNPQDFAHQLYTLDPVISCGLTWEDDAHPFGQYVSNCIYRQGFRGLALVTDGVTSFRQWDAPHETVRAINPPWVRRFNQSLRRLAGGQPSVEILPGVALGRLGAALGPKFPESPYAGAEIVWPCYKEGVDDPADRPYGITGKLDGWQLDKAVNVCSEGRRFVILNFKRGLLRRGIFLDTPEYFPVHSGLEELRDCTVEDVKITRAFGDNISKYVITFDNGQKIAVPNQGPISDGEEVFSNIPF